MKLQLRGALVDGVERETHVESAMLVNSNQMQVAGAGFYPAYK
jgi:hypothetical protein